MLTKILDFTLEKTYKVSNMKNKNLKYTFLNADSGQCDSVIALLHGHGMSGKDMMSFAKDLSRAFPKAIIIMPDGPVKVGKRARAWFSIENIDLEKIIEQTQLDPSLAKHFNSLNVIQQLNTTLDHFLASHGVRADRLAIFGFSQGGMVALHAALKRSTTCAAVVSHSSFFGGVDKVSAKPQTLLISGDQDFLTQKGCLSQNSSADRLRKAGVPVKTHVEGALGHDVNKETLKRSMRFIGKNLGYNNT